MPRAPSLPTSCVDDETLMRRAFAAYFRAGGTEQPDRGLSTIVEHEDPGVTRMRATFGAEGPVKYVLLRNVSGLLRVYRVLPGCGGLKALKRWPKGLGA